MGGSFQRLRSRFPRGFLLWAGLTTLLALGVLTSLVDLGKVPAAETRRANTVQQRIIIDPMTGEVSGLKGETSEAFDVAEETKAEPATPPAHEESDAPPVEPPAEPLADAPEPATPDAAAESGFEPLRRTPRAVSLPKITRSAESLVAAPAREITEKIGKLSVPLSGGNNARAATLYARGFKRREDQAIVAFVVTDAGFSDAAMAMLLDLPPEVSVGVSPYAHESAKQVALLRNAGHEVWTMLPAMTARYPQDDPGPLGLIVALDKKETRDRLYRILSATIGSVGVILPSDEAASTQPELWSTLLDELVKRGLYLLSTHPTRGIEQLTTDPAAQAAIRRADITLDSTPSIAFIRSKLAGIKDSTLTQGHYVVLVSARPQALRVLSDWLKDKDNSLKASNIALAPLSAMYAPTALDAAAETSEEATEGDEKASTEEAKPEGEAKPDDKEH